MAETISCWIQKLCNLISLRATNKLLQIEEEPSNTIGTAKWRAKSLTPHTLQRMGE
jgi:hypothetical protein